MAKIVYQAVDGSVHESEFEADEQTRVVLFAGAFEESFENDRDYDIDPQALARWIIDNERQTLELLDRDTLKLGDEDDTAPKNKH